MAKTFSHLIFCVCVGWIARSGVTTSTIHRKGRSGIMRHIKTVSLATFSRLLNCRMVQRKKKRYERCISLGV